MTNTDEAAEYRQPRRWVMVLCLVPLMATIASSHQLTPFMLLGALILLVAFRQLRPRTLPLVMAAITVGWIMYGGLPWLKANSAQIFVGVGDPWANVGVHIVGQGQVPTGQILVDWDSRAISAAIGILALIGFWRYRRHHDAKARSSWNRLAVLAVAALPAAAANNYGGEIVFRVFLFALPFMAVAAAACFFPDPRTELVAQVRGASGRRDDLADRRVQPRQLWPGSDKLPQPERCRRGRLAVPDSTAWCRARLG